MMNNNSTTGNGVGAASDEIKLVISETMLHTSGVIKKYDNPAIHPPEMQEELNAIYYDATQSINNLIQEEKLKAVIEELNALKTKKVKGADLVELKWIKDRTHTIRQLLNNKGGK